MNFKGYLRALRHYFFYTLLSPLSTPLCLLADIAVQRRYRDAMSESKNPFNSFGRKVFSQSDEDGLTFEIIKRLNIKCGVFAECGVGDGSENNSLVLLAQGWKGIWLGAENLCFDYQTSNTRLAYEKAWITLDNIIHLLNRGLSAISAGHPDLISVDLDGNDWYIVEKLLACGFRPKVFIVEYNSKFPPPMKWKIIYDAGHVMRGDDYFGCSLAEYSELLSSSGYFLVCCNSHTGANAFFVREEYRELFPEIPDDIELIYQRSSHVYKYRDLPATSHRTISSLINDQTYDQKIVVPRNESK